MIKVEHDGGELMTCEEHALPSVTAQGWTLLAIVERSAVEHHTTKDSYGQPLYNSGNAIEAKPYLVTKPLFILARSKDQTIAGLDAALRHAEERLHAQNKELEERAKKINAIDVRACAAEKKLAEEKTQRLADALALKETHELELKEAFSCFAHDWSVDERAAVESIARLGEPRLVLEWIRNRKRERARDEL